MMKAMSATRMPVVVQLQRNGLELAALLREPAVMQVAALVVPDEPAVAPREPSEPGAIAVGLALHAPRLEAELLQQRGDRREVRGAVLGAPALFEAALVGELLTARCGLHGGLLLGGAHGATALGATSMS